MLSKYSLPIFERQKERFPGYISQLENLSSQAQPEFKALIALLIHGIRNDLMIVAMVLEIQTLGGADIVPCTVI